LVSAQPGLIPQITGNLTGQRINGATVIVDHFSDHVYVYLMRNLTLDKTILAKHAYERFLSSIGVIAKAYHADNGRFADQGFRDECNRSNQTITFCGVGSHHQNGIAERKIKELTLGARTLLLHAKRMLPEHISTILWPFALICAEDRLNHLLIGLMVELLMRLLLISILPASTYPIFTLLEVPVTYLINDFNLDLV
jgi:hypothetical protein